jgi:predicted nucleotidyltransferase
MTAQLNRQIPADIIPQETINSIVATIAEHFSPEKIVLFGSYASGTAVSGSDLDLLVVMESDLPRHRRSVPIQLLFKPMPCPMDILVYTPEEVNKWRGTVNHIVTEAFATGRTAYERRA